jgi:anti-anti-sigma factor
MARKKTTPQDVALEVVCNIGRAVATEIELPALLELIYHEAGRVMDTAGFAIGLYDPLENGLRFDILYDRGERLEPLLLHKAEGWGLAGRVYEERAPLIFADLAESGELAEAVQVGEVPRSWLGVPLIARERAIGVMSVQSYEADAFGPDDQRLLEAIASQAAVSIENLFLRREHERRIAELFALNEIGQAIITATGVEDILEAIYRETSRVMDTSNLYVALYHPEAAQATFDFFIEDGKRVSPDPASLSGGGLTVHIVTTREPLLLEDAEKDMAERGLSAIGRPAKSYLGVPMLAGDRVVGVIAVQSPNRARAYDRRHQDLLGNIANLAAVAIENTRLSSEREQRLVELSVVNEISRALSSSLTVEQMLDIIHQQVSRTFDATNFYIALYDEAADEWYTPLQFEYGQRQEPIWHKGSEGLTGAVIGSRQPVVLHTLEENIAFDETRGVQTIGQRPLSWMGVPLIAADKVVGVMGIQSYEHENLYGEQDLALFSTIAAEAAIALDNTRLLREHERRIAELSALNEIGRAIITTTQTEDILEAIYREASRVMDTSNLYLALYHPEEELVTFDYHIEDGQRIDSAPLYLSDGGLTVHIINTRQPLLLGEDLEREVAELGIEPKGRPAVSYLGVPMLVGDRVVGVIAVQSPSHPRAYDRRHLELLSNIANLAAVAIENARLSHEREQRITELSSVTEISRAVSSSLDLNQLLKTAHQQISRVFETTNFFIVTYEEETDEWILALSVERGKPDDRTGNRYKVGAGLTGYIIRSRQPLLLRTMAENISFKEAQSIPAIGEQALSWMGVPLVAADKLVGVMAIQSYEQENLYNEQSLALFSTIGTQVASAIENARLFSELGGRLADLSVVNEVSQSMLVADSQEDLLEAVHRQVGRVMEATNFYVALYDEPRQELDFAYTVEDGKKVPGHRKHPLTSGGVTVYIVEHRKPLFLEEDMDAQLVARGIVGLGRPAKSYMGVPMIAGDQILGAMAVQSYEREHAFTARHQALFTNISTQAALAVQRIRLRASEARKARQLAIIGEVSRKVTAILDLNELLRELARSIQLGFGYSNVAVFRIDEQTQEAVLGALVGRYAGIMEWGYRQPLKEGLVGWAARNEQTLRCNNVLEDSRYVRGFDAEEIVSSEMCVPISFANRVIGVLDIQAEAADAFDDQDVAAMETLAGQLAAAMRNAVLFHERGEQLANLNALNRVIQATAASLSLDDLLTSLCDVVVELMSPDGFFVALIEKETGDLVAPLVMDEGVFYRATRLARKGFTDYMLEIGQPVLIRDMNVEAANYPVERVTLVSGRPASSWLGVPLRSGDEIIGAIVVNGHRPYAFDEQDKGFLEAVASQLVVSIDKARLFEETRRALDDLRSASEQQRLLLDVVRELSTPLVPIAEGILVLPLVGTIDSQRAQQIMDVLLDGISSQRARVVILDITGVPIVDTSVANYLLQATQAVRLLGAECILVGITPEVAQTVVGLGVELHGLITRSDLQGGVEYALRLMGQRIVKPARRPLLLEKGVSGLEARTPEPVPPAP